MPQLKAILSILTGIILIFFGEQMALDVYKNYYQNSTLAWLGILAFIILFTGSIMVCVPIVNFSQSFDNWTKKTNKSKLFKAMTFTPLLGLCFAPFVASVGIFITLTSDYKWEQIEKHGIVKKVEITGKIDYLRSRHDLLFSFEHNGETYEGMLDRWIYNEGDSVKNVGDSILMIFSSENPGEQAWYYKFKERRE